DCRKTLRLLNEAVVEYQPAPALADAVAVRRAERGIDVIHTTDFPDRRRHVLHAVNHALDQAAEATQASVPVERAAT
ncbi:MAG TPA: hypothetical protein VFS52_13945, partial [Steroidobacteraceae bacterium]|nr:hypothetical protein [Steroidobacteraceae bacterium]